MRTSIYKGILFLLLCVTWFTMPHTLYAQEQAEEKIKVVVTDDGVLFNGESTTMEAVPEQFWQALQRNPRIKYSISANSNKAETIKRMQQLSTSVMEYLSRQQLVVGAANSEENRLRIDIKSNELIVRLGTEDLHQLFLTEMDSLRSLVADFVSRREVGEKRHFSLADGTEFDHVPNDAVVVTFASERSAEIENIAQSVSMAVADGYDMRRSAISEQVLSLPYHELDNVSRSVFMAAVPKRTQSNVVQTKTVRPIKENENDNSKALDMLKMCLIKADGTFAWEGKSYSIDDIQKVLGTDFDTSKLMFDAPLVQMIMEEAFGVKAPNLHAIDTASLLRVLGFSMPNMVGGIVNVVAHSAKVLRENPELMEAYVPISISGLDLVALNNDGVEVSQIANASSLEVRFTIVGNDSCRSGNKKLTISLLELSSGQEFLVQHTAAYENKDLPISIPFVFDTPLKAGIYLVAIQHGKKSLGVIEVEMR